MTQFHVILEDETQCEFSVTIESDDDSVFKKIAENYPESTIVSVQTPIQLVQEKHDRYVRLLQEINEDAYYGCDDD